MRLAALYRNPTFSPGRHRDNDAAILDAVVARVVAAGHTVVQSSELEVERGRLPRADGYLNMCQGPVASRRLIEATSRRAPVLNAAASVLNCHRARLVALLTGAGLPFPETVILASTPGDRPRLPGGVTSGANPIWVKRGDVHAQSPEDVVSVPPGGVEAAVARFARRGIATVAIQAHVGGPVVKFYGVQGTDFFDAYLALPGHAAETTLDLAELGRLASRAAEVLGLVAFGGDAAFPDPDRPVLIDVNDWPSYAPVREAAAEAIAGRFLHLLTQE